MILFRYIFVRFLAMLLRVTLIFAALLFTIGVVDELGSLSQGQGLSRAAYLAAIGQAETLYTILPLLVIIAAISMFLGMSRSSEIVAVRASGQSGLRFLLAPSFAALLVGLLAIAVFNPIVTVFSTQFAQEKGRAAPSAVLSLGATGLWLRQGDEAQQTMVRALSSDMAALELRDVSFLSFDEMGTAVQRIETPRARLSPGAWILAGGYEWDLTAANPQLSRKTLPDNTRLSSDLQPSDVTSGFGKPNSVPIYALPAHIAALEKAGFSARPFRVWLHSELAKPLTLVVMVLVAAGFTMRHIRAGNTAQMVLYAVLLGFGIFFLRNIAQVMGQNGHIPILLAAWGPVFAVSLLAISLLLHLEEG